MRRRAILIHGPTASGKSALALACARRLGGEIVNADSIQVYSDLRVLTARPTTAEMSGVVHHLFGHVDGGCRHSAAMWLAAAEAVLRQIDARGRVAIITGGTGLYLKALISGLSPIPAIPPEIRKDAMRRVSEGSGHADLGRLDPHGASRIRPRDTQRTARALEVVLATGQPLHAHYRQERTPLLREGQWTGLILSPPREMLAAGIAHRFAGMLENGALSEAEAILASKTGSGLPIMKAHGLPHLLAHLRGEMTLADAIVRACTDTRRYAKRQRTWIAHQFPGWPRITARDTGLRVEVAMRLYAEVLAPVD